MQCCAPPPPPGGVLNRNLGRGVRPTQQNPDPVQDTCLRESAVISYPVLDWTKQVIFKTLRTVHKFAFSRISKKAHEISKNYVIEGGEKEKIYGDKPG